MDQLYEQLISRETLILGFTVFIVTFFIRRIVETAVPSCKGKDGAPYKTKFGLWWNSVILYAIPVVLGSALAIWAFTAEVLQGDFKTIPGAGMWGAIVGWCSSFTYKFVRKFIKKKTGVDITPTLSDPTKDSDPPEKKPEIDDEDTPEETPSSKGE
jgi:hypothetical protein